MHPEQALPDPAGTWDTNTAVEWHTDLPPMPASSRALAIPLQSNMASMLVVDVLLECPGKAGGYKTWFVVEWAGTHTLHLCVSSFEPIDNPRAKTLQDEAASAGKPDRSQGPVRFSEMTVLRLRVRDATFPGTVLHIGPPAWHDDMPLIPINPNECLLEDFTATRFWDLADWARNERCTLTAERSGLKKIWFFAELWFRGQPASPDGPPVRVSYTRQCRRDISEFQAITVSTSIDRRVLFSLILTIDGRDVAIVDRRQGAGDGEELRVPLSGNWLQAITFEIEETREAAGQSVDQVIGTMVRWLLLERRGADPAQANEVRGMTTIGAPQSQESFEQSGLPIGLLFGRDDVASLREKIKSESTNTEPAKRIFEEILAEAHSHLDYQPEHYVGRYLPIDYGNSQGAGRMSAPMQEMARYNSCMVYNGLVYALTGQPEHGAVARRALLATLSCDEWASGFVSRIPVGLPGYRAPFVTASAACAVALCYDMIYPLLSAQERQAVEDTLYQKAIPWLDLYLRLFGEGYLLESNQGPVFSRGLVYAARVAGRSHPHALKLLDKWVAWFQRMMTVCYERDGSTNEGPSYWEYTTHETVAELLAISRYLGKPVAELAPPNVVKSLDYMLHMRSLSSQTLSFLNIGDCTVSESRHMGGILLFFARHLKSQAAQWLWNTYYASRRHSPGDAFFGTALGPYVIDGLLTLLLCDHGDPQPPQLPPSKRFEVCDRVLWRSGVNYGDTLLFFEGGPMIPGHAHPDKGQFLLEAFGERLIADPGMVNYADPASESLQASACHNVITIGGQDQSYKDLKKAVIIETLADTDQYSYLCADVSNAYQEVDVFRRQLLFVRPDYFLLLDDVVAKAGDLAWHLHSAGTLTVQGETILIDAPKAGMLIHVASTCALSARTGVYSSGTGILTHNLTLAPAQDERTLQIAALMVPFSHATPTGRPAITQTSQVSETRFVVTGAWGTDSVTIQPAGRVDPATGRRSRQITVARQGMQAFQIDS